jgi:hypothetical protein
MFSFISAGSRSAHYFALLAAGPVRSERACWSTSRAVSRQTGKGRSLSENGAQLGFQCFVKIALELANRISAINATRIPNIRNPVDNCPKGVYRKITA